MIRSRWMERSYPYAIAGCLSLLVWYRDLAPAGAKLDSLLTSAISVSAILMGFLGTAKAMLLGFRSPKFAWMKSNSRVWTLLLGYLRSAFVASVFACACSLILLATDPKLMPASIQSLVVPAWVALFAVSVLTFYRVITVFFSILSGEREST